MNLLCIYIIFILVFTALLRAASQLNLCLEIIKDIERGAKETMLSLNREKGEIYIFFLV